MLPDPFRAAVRVGQCQLHVALPAGQEHLADRDIPGRRVFSAGPDLQRAAVLRLLGRQAGFKAPARCPGAALRQQAPVRRRQPYTNLVPIRRLTKHTDFLPSAQHRAVRKQRSWFQHPFRPVPQLYSSTLNS